MPADAGIVEQNVHAPAGRLPELRDSLLPCRGVPHIEHAARALGGGYILLGFGNACFVHVIEADKPSAFGK